MGMDTKQDVRRVQFTSPISRAQDYFIFQSAKSLHRVLYPPEKHDCLVYKGTRLQQERQRQQSMQDATKLVDHIWGNRIK